MSQITKKIIVFLLLVIIFNLSYSFNKPVAFPADTVQRFIKKYGKDSLISLLNKKIKSTAQFIKSNAPALTNDIVAMELNLNSKHFKLGIDTVIYANANTANTFYKLYGNYYGNIEPVIKNLEKIKNSNQDIYELLVQNMTTNPGRIGVAIYCDYFKIPAKALDTLFEYSSTLSELDKIQTFWMFTEFSKNCGNSNPVSYEYVDKYFTELHNSYSLKEVLPKVANYTLGNQLNDDNMKIYYSLKVLAYSLYADKVNLNEHASDLMYLLKLQSSVNKSLPKNTIKTNVDLEAASYTLWSLCEFRDKLKTIK